MLRYCKQDVKVNADVYFALIEEFKVLYKRNPMIKDGLRIEHDTAKFNAFVKEEGWNFNVEKANSTLMKMMDRMMDIESVIEPKLGLHTVFIDKEPKTPKYKKNGEYTANTVRILSEYFNKTVLPTDTHLMEPGTEFQRSKAVSYTHLTLPTKA